jgi:hypothetical protein
LRVELLMGSAGVGGLAAGYRDVLALSCFEC